MYTLYIKVKVLIVIISTTPICTISEKDLPSPKIDKDFHCT